MFFYLAITLCCSCARIVGKDNQIKIKSSLYSPYYAEACNELRGPSPRLSAWATQLRRNVATVASRWRHCVDLTGPGIEPQTSRTDSVRFATELTAGLSRSNEGLECQKMENILDSIKKIKSNLHYTRRITPKRVTSCGAHLRGLAPGLHSSEETSQRQHLKIG